MIIYYNRQLIKIVVFLLHRLTVFLPSYFSFTTLILAKTDFSILAKTDNSFDLLIYESLLILRDRPSLNSQQSSIPMALF